MLPRAQPREYGRRTTAADTSDRGHVSGITAPGCGCKAKKVRPRTRIFLSDLTLPRPLLSQDAGTRKCCREHSRESTAAGRRPRIQATTAVATSPGLRPRDADKWWKDVSSSGVCSVGKYGRQEVVPGGGCGRGGRVQGEDEGSRQPGGRRT